MIFIHLLTDNKEFDLTNYDEILEQQGIKQNIDVINTSDLSTINEQTILALILMAIRADRFSDGTLVCLFKNGSILRCLERLKIIYENTEKSSNFKWN